MQDQLADFVAMLTTMLNGDEEALEQFRAAPLDTVESQISGVPVEDIDPAALLADALAASDLDADAQAEVVAALTGATESYDVPAEGGYTPQQLADVFAQSLNATLEEGDYIDVDNSLYADGGEAAHGEYGHDDAGIKGGIDQYNTTNIVDADDGAVVAEGAWDSNFQTGSDNVQADGVWADNITTGDGNTVASQGSVIGDGNVNAGHIANSEFGDGDQDRSVDVEVGVEDSFNTDTYVKEDYSNDDVVDVALDVDVKDGHGHGYERIEEVAHEAGLEDVAEYLDAE